MKYVPDSYIERNDMADEPGPPDPEDLCMVCGKLDCICQPDHGIVLDHPLKTYFPVPEIK